MLNEKKHISHPQRVANFEYIVNSGVKGVVDLPDGSRVWLNSSSSLKCPEKFDSLQRVVELDGEGYFEVVPDKEWPMYVKTYKGYGVKVTGTTFNLSSYSNDNKLIVTLISGKISVVHEQNKSEIKLNPAEQITITGKETPILVKKANIEYNTAWKKGYLLFDNTPMDEVIRKMERWYGVSFIIKDSSIFDYRFTANFKSESISQVLEILKLSSNIKYEIDKTRITLKNI
jgi:ferric-dicitrate binding protein FerR (iron transport regulator)